MRGRTWTTEESALLRELYPTTPWDTLTKTFRRSEMSLQHQARILGVRRETKKQWTAAADEQLRQRYPHMRSDVLARELGTSLAAVYARAAGLGLRKTKDFRASPESGIMTKGNTRGRATQFKKGATSWNKGMKGLHLPGCEKGQFKKGNLPANTLHDGAVVVRQRKKKQGAKPYQYIRIAQAKWMTLHTKLWEDANGPVPAGHIIVFMDGNTMNTALENLHCITRAQHAANTRDTDEFIARLMSQRGRGKIDRTVYNHLLKHPALLDVKRKQLQLRRALHETEQQV